MKLIIVYCIILLALIIAKGSGQCCNDNCIYKGVAYDCNNKCTIGKLCKLDEHIKHLAFEGNQLGQKPFFLFPYQENIVVLNIGHNEIKGIISGNIFRSFPNLRNLNLAGNEIGNATFDLTVNHDLEKLEEVQAECVYNLDKFPKLSQIDITIHGSKICDNILGSNIKRIILNLKNIHSLNETKFDSLQNTSYIELRLPQVTQLQEDNFEYFTRVTELVLDIPNVTYVAPHTLQHLINLEKLTIKSPKLRSFPNEILSYRIGKNYPKLKEIELCPALDLPQHILVNH